MNCIEHQYEELYDTAHDPHETTHLAQNATYAQKLNELRRPYAALKRAAQ